MLFPFSSTTELTAFSTKMLVSAKYVLLGEASHGTSEFYRIRSDLTKQLIQEHGFSFHSC